MTALMTRGNIVLSHSLLAVIHDDWIMPAFFDLSQQLIVSLCFLNTGGKHSDRFLFVSRNENNAFAYIRGCIVHLMSWVVLYV